MELIDEGLLHTYDEAIEKYVDAKEKINTGKAAAIALLNSYSSKMNDINLLLQNYRYSSANIVMRTAFENEIYIRYIFERQIDEKPEEQHISTVTFKNYPTI